MIQPVNPLPWGIEVNERTVGGIDPEHGFAINGQRLVPFAFRTKGLIVPHMYALTGDGEIAEVPIDALPRFEAFSGNNDPSMPGALILFRHHKGTPDINTIDQASWDTSYETDRLRLLRVVGIDEDPDVLPASQVILGEHCDHLGQFGLYGAFDHVGDTSLADGSKIRPDYLRPAAITRKVFPIGAAALSPLGLKF